MAKYKTTITKKDGSTASGYIENDRGYYDDGSAMNVGDSIVDASNKVWTKYGNSGLGNGSGSNGGTGGTGGTGNGAGNPNNSGSGNGSPSYNDILANNGIPTSSSRGSYKISSVDRPERTAYLRSARELGELYDIDYDMAAIRSIYDEATNAKYALLSKELEQGENDFYTNNAQANATLLDTLKKATSSAIATGASRGLASAEQLGLMMEQQQAITDEATNIAQERANMADEIALEKAENIIKAMEYSNSLKQGLATNSTNVYSADTQYDVGLLDWAAQMKNVEALFDQIAAEKETNAAAQALQRELALLEDARLRDEGAANRASNEKIAADNAAAQQAYYNYMMKTAGSGGGYGSGSGKYIDVNGNLDYNAIWAAGDVPAMMQYLMGVELLSSEEAQERIKSDKQFMQNAKNGGYSKANDIKTIEQQAIADGDLVTLARLNAIGEGTNWWNHIDDVVEAWFEHPIVSARYYGSGIANGAKAVGSGIANGAKAIGDSITSIPARMEASQQKRTLEQVEKAVEQWNKTHPNNQMTVEEVMKNYNKK